MQVHQVLAMKKAFTLIELLVVIAIIAILAAILFPVFAQAKVAAKKTADLNNTKQLGISMQIYINDYDDTYMPSNHRIAPDYVQEVHWSWMVLPYVKNEQIFVSPADANGGWAPGCFDESTNNRGFGHPGIQNNGCTQQGYPAGMYTMQVGRLSYTANQILIPRRRQPGDEATVVTSTAIDDVSGTILLMPMAEKAECLQKDVGGEFRTYRPAMTIARKGQKTLSGSGALPTGGDLPLEIITQATAAAVFNCTNGVRSVPDHTLRYTHVGRFDKGNNYVMADTSAKFRNTYSTLSPQKFMYGKRAYSLGGYEIIDPATGLAIQ